MRSLELKKCVRTAARINRMPELLEGGNRAASTLSSFIRKAGCNCSVSVYLNIHFEFFEGSMDKVLPA